MRNALVVAEVALSVVLLVGAALFIGSFRSLMKIDPGFDPANVLTASISAAARRQHLHRHHAARLLPRSPADRRPRRADAWRDVRGGHLRRHAARRQHEQHG